MTFKEFLKLSEGGLWSNPGVPDNNGRGNKRQGIAWTKDLYNSGPGVGGQAVPTATPPPTQTQQKMKK